MPPVTITFNPNRPSGQQINCNPDVVHVPFGNGQTVTFNLTGPNGTAFASNGIYFKNSSPGTLTRDSNTQYTLTDDNDNATGQEVDYPYGINVSYQGTDYGQDPEVANDSGGGAMTVRYHSS